ncbi:MAG: response regulator [Chloroflexi bacterium]|nr:response regulator [Chloroflexota bacterium]
MNERILVVEDERQMLRLLGMTLEKEGYRIVAAQTAAAARAQIQAAVPDVVILDVMLPDTSGLDLCRELRQHPATSAVPILMLSAMGQVSDKVAGLKAGADEYVVKPIDSVELVARVGSLLERSRRLRGQARAEPATVVSFLGSKGGVGTTTTLVNVAACLTLEGKRAIAVELRPELGQLQTLLGLSTGDSTRTLFSLEPARIQSTSVSAWIVRHSSGVQVLPAPLGIQPDAHFEPAQAMALVAALKELADVVLLDLPPCPRPETEVAIASSDIVLLNMEPTRLGLESAAALAAYAKAHARPAAKLLVVIINRAPLATPVGVRQIEERLGWVVVGGIPPAPDECARAQQLGAPVVQAAPDSTASQAFKALAQGLLRLTPQA